MLFARQCLGFRLRTINDLHKPALDGIGFQELITSQMAWFDSTAIDGGGSDIYSAGKQPAWINYMTDVDTCHGDFADEKKAMYMTLNRKYEQDEETGRIKDLTTYIDPTKYNYAFADTTLEAQNFWVRIANKVIVRRKISAKIIPNL